MNMPSFQHASLNDTSSWISPRIWRSSTANYGQNDALHAADSYDDATLGQIASQGFDGVWVRGRLRDLMNSTILPELNVAQHEDRLKSLQTAIARAARHGIKFFLYFNDPLALAEHDPFWQTHPDLRGASHKDFGKKIPYYALCTSAPAVKTFVSQAIDSILEALPGLGGVILITASEDLTHCWSQYSRFGLDDGVVFPADKPLSCPRCIERQPAEVVSELIGWWRQSMDRHNPDGLVIAWNWSWSFWYKDPQREVIDALPSNIQFMADFERGSYRPWRDQSIWTDEYSLGFVGPSDRFLGSKLAADARGLTTLAKLQIGTTHEIGNVPNLPLLTNLHSKFVAMTDLQIKGAMCTWAVGCAFTLNTFAMGLFAEDPQRFRDADIFFDALSQRYMGLHSAGRLSQAWELFSQTWALFPTSLKLLYFGPVNIAPGLPLVPTYRDEKLMGTWRYYTDYGDRLHEACGPFTLEQVTDALGDMSDMWDQGLAAMQDALTPEHVASSSPEMARHRFEELSCARMIGIQLRSAYHVLAFHQWKLQKIESLKLTPPCEDLPLDDTARRLIALELQNITPALALTQADDRLGFHTEAQRHLYDAATIERKIQIMQQLIDVR